MDIRETISRHSKISTIVMSCVVVGCIVAVGMEIRSGNGAPPSKNFFTADDGQTWFADSSSKLPPFDHDGAKAVRCYVFEGKNGKFAGLLEKYSDSTLKQLATETSRPTSIPVLIKKPGEKEWKNVAPEEEAMILMRISAPDGSDAELVMP